MATRTNRNRHGSCRDIEGPTEIREADIAGIAIAAARHYELLDAAMARRGGARSGVGRVLKNSTIGS